MKTLADKLRKVAEVVAREKPKLHFFGLIPAHDLPDRWDLLVSANKLGSDVSRFEYIVARLKNELTTKDMLKIMQVVFLPTNDPLIVSLRGDGDSRDRLDAAPLTDPRDLAIILWPPKKSAATARVA